MCPGHTADSTVQEFRPTIQCSCLNFKACENTIFETYGSKKSQLQTNLNTKNKPQSALIVAKMQI